MHRMIAFPLVLVLLNGCRFSVDSSSRKPADETAAVLDESIEFSKLLRAEQAAAHLAEEADLVSMPTFKAERIANAAELETEFLMEQLDRDEEEYEGKVQ